MIRIATSVILMATVALPSRSSADAELGRLALTTWNAEPIENHKS
jgi:hypothetical protein